MWNIFLMHPVGKTGNQRGEMIENTRLLCRPSRKGRGRSWGSAGELIVSMAMACGLSKGPSSYDIRIADSLLGSLNICFVDKS